jgi:murein DD-endopeptidase MepM/ murein hydrolase activator NlpD
MVISKNGFLSIDEMVINAEYIMGFLLGKGWTKNAVAGMLGNMQTESTINPGIWQNLDSGNMSMGYGLVQWTPATKYIDWANSRGLDYPAMDSQILRIEYEVENNIQWFGGYSSQMSFKEFTQSNETPEYLAEVFIKTYEHPADPNQPIRGTQARYWFDNLSGEGGTTHFIFPTDAPVSSEFRSPDRPDHHGVDFAASGTNEIKASASGTVSQSYVSSSYGEVVYIQTEIDGVIWEHVYAHMQTGSRTVSVGDSVTQGQVIGIMGNTGDSTGQHLHFELHKGGWNDSKSNAVDPLLYLGVSSGGGGGDVGNPKQDMMKDYITLMLTDTLNGWKW